MECFVRGDKNCMGSFVQGGKLMRDVLSGGVKNGMGCFVLHSHKNNPYSLRNANDLHTIHANTSLYYTSILPSTGLEWNSLPNNIRQADSLTIYAFEME